MVEMQLVERPLDVHRRAPYRCVVLKRDQSESPRPTAGFSIRCGEKWCEEHHEIAGPPSMPPDAVMNKFKQLGWLVSSGDWRKNRCPTHAKGERTTRPTASAARPPKFSALDLLFKSPEQLAAEAAARPPATPADKPDYRPRVRQTPPPRDPGVHGPHTIKTKIFAQTGIDNDLDKLHRQLAGQLKQTQAHARQLEAMIVTVGDAMKRIGQFPQETTR